MIRSIKELSHLSGVRVLVRADFNVPIEDGRVMDPLRIGATLSTFEHLLAGGARVIIVSHMSDPRASLAPVFEFLRKKIPLMFVSDVAGTIAHIAANGLTDGKALLLENLRWNPGEEKNDRRFALELASLADVYVNEGFPVSHRAHASIVGVPKVLPAFAGIQFLNEIERLTPALTPKSPSLAVIGGAKFITKEKLIRSLLKKYDKLFIGGAIVNDFFAAQGYRVGKSLVGDPKHVQDLLGNSKIIMPTDVTVASPAGSMDKKIEEVGDEDIIMDIGPASIASLAPHLEKAKTILWNGPMGNFENGFRRGTDDLATMIAKAKGETIIGGGETLSSIQSLKLSDRFTFISTAGGAMLDFLANGTLPGIEAIESSPAFDAAVTTPVELSR